MIGGQSNHPGFDACVELVLSNDALTFEEGYGLLVNGETPLVREHVEELIELMQRQTDPFMRGRFIELLGFTASAKVIPVLKAELAHPDQHVREWAVLSLQDLPFSEAVGLAEDYKAKHPEEW